MGLDAHVIPISAFVAGDYTSALELVLRSTPLANVPVTQIGPGGAVELTPPRTVWGQFQRYTGLWSLRKSLRRRQARGRRSEGLVYVHWLRERLYHSLGKQLEWSEEGDSVLTHQIFRSALHALRVFALRMEFPQELGSIAASGKEGDPDLVELVYERQDSLSLSSERFRHLCDHSDVHGFYLPLDFDPLQWIKDPRYEEESFLQSVPVGSSVRLLAELEGLKSSLGIREVWNTDQLGVPSEGTEDPFLAEAQLGWKLLEGFARTSVRTRLPICFDG